MEIIDYAFIIYILIWCSLVVTDFFIRGRLKKLYPDMFEEYHATYKTNSIPEQMKYLRFNLNSKYWKPIQDSQLIALLHISRTLFLTVLLFLTSAPIYFLINGTMTR